MPRLRTFQARPDPGHYVPLTITLDRGTYEAMEADARQDDVPVERFIALHLRKCAEAGGYPVD